MEVEKIKITDPTELEKIYQALNNSIGKILYIQGFRCLGRNIEERHYFERWGVVQDVYYHDGFGRVSCAFFENDFPLIENFNIGFITGLTSLNNELLYYRSNPFYKQEKGRKND